MLNAFSDPLCSKLCWHNRRSLIYPPTTSGSYCWLADKIHVDFKKLKISQSLLLYSYLLLWAQELGEGGSWVIAPRFYNFSIRIRVLVYKSILLSLCNPLEVSAS